MVDASSRSSSLPQNAGAGEAMEVVVVDASSSFSSLPQNAGAGLIMEEVVVGDASSSFSSLPQNAGAGTEVVVVVDASEMSLPDPQNAVLRGRSGKVAVGVAGAIGRAATAAADSRAKKVLAKIMLKAVAVIEVRGS